jgi:hypothetical protein
LELLASEGLAIDANLLGGSDDARPELRDDLTIDLDATFENKILTLAAAGEACGGEHFL